MKGEVIVEIYKDVFDTVKAFSMMLLSPWKESSEFKLNFEKDSIALASLVARNFLTSKDSKTSRRL